MIRRTSAGRAAICAAAAGVVGAALLWLGPRGTDLAAHVYQRQLYLTHGFALWNNFWYTGRYSFVGYSLVYYPLAALLGIKLLGLLSVAGAAGAFAVVAEREWGDAARRPAQVFAIVAAASVLSAAFPYMLGLAFALAALAALQTCRFALFALLAPGTVATSPLAFLLLLVVLLAAATRSGLRVRPAVAIACTCVAGVAVWRLFPGGGRYPFSPAELTAALAFCGLGIVFTWRVPQARLLSSIFATYAAACLLAYLIPSPIGENIARLRYVAMPVALLTLSLRRWRPLVPALAAFALALWWNVSPLAFSVARAANDPSAERGYWTPTIRFLSRELSPSYRVEAVDTVDHWDAVYLAEAGIPIVRGWFRQDDFPQNELLYDRVGRRSYIHWLRRMGVRYVVLTTAPVDYSARGEARLLRSGASGLELVFRSATSAVYAVPSPQPIVTGPARARVLTLSIGGIAFQVPRPGTYHVAIRYTPYWSGGDICIRPTKDGMFDVDPSRRNRRSPLRRHPRRRARKDHRPRAPVPGPS
jgi:hypothetical protein